MKHLPIFSGFFIAAVITLGYFGFFPVSWWAGIVLFLCAMGLSVRYPQAMFGIFLASIPLEIFPMLSMAGNDVRWYQALGAALVLGVGVRSVWKRENPFRKFPFSKMDGVLTGVGVAGIVSAVYNGELALKQTVIFASFLFLYFVIRYFIRNREEVSKYAPFLFVSFFLVMLYGTIQNIFFAVGLPSLEVMAGRPNATFSEADWFGLYAALGVVVASGCIFYGILLKDKHERKKAFCVFSSVLFCMAMVGLILSVARSAWLAAFSGLVAIKLSIFFRYGFRVTWQWGMRVGALLTLSLVFVFGTHLSSFEMKNRTQSIATGLQEITVACPGGRDTALPRTIGTVEDLKVFDCFMIDLEEIDGYQNRGFLVQKIFRKDPNASIRKEIWRKSVGVIGDYPILGVGWGNIGAFLGVDERGAILSSSNIFLEFWLGAGIIGCIGVVFLFGDFLARIARSVKRAISDSNSLKDGEFAYPLFALGLVIALLVFNLFNSAHFLMVTWAVWAFAQALLNEESEV